jgi:hypothetical protein
MKRDKPPASRSAIVALVPVLALALALLGACDAAEGVRVESLPPLERPTPEARAGLPEIAGTWRFAGWEVTSHAVLAEFGEPPLPGDLVIETQRVDSLAGYLIRGEMVLALSGEVRRDGIVSLMTLQDTAAESSPRFAAGRLVRDTLWIELTTLPAGNLSPPTQRWAFFRGMVGQPFLRLPTGQLLRDTVVAPPPEAPAVPPATPAMPRDPAAPAPPPADRPATQADPPAPPRRPEPDPPRDPPPARGQPPVDTARPQPPPSPQIDIPPFERY